jgi:3-methyladenine DNA glycosylase/8-oxoguanine DNA glycosylase
LRPDPARLATESYAAFHRFGVERRRAETILRVCRRATELDALAATATGAGRARVVLHAIPGIGPWTSATVIQQAFGDPDAIIVGDYHLPNIVAWNLAGEARATDERMLELLEPFAPHRARAVRLLAADGAHAPRRGPGRRIRSIASI